MALGAFLSGFCDELIKLGALPAPVAVPATGRGLGIQAGTPSEAIGPTNSFRNALQPQAMMSPPKVPQSNFRPTAGPKPTAQPAETSPAPKKGTGQAAPKANDDRKPFESELGYQVRRAGEQGHNAGMSAATARANAPKPSPAQPGAPRLDPTAAKPVQVTPHENPKMGVPMAQPARGQTATPAAPPNQAAPNQSKAQPWAAPASSPLAMPKPVKPPQP